MSVLHSLTAIIVDLSGDFADAT